MNTCTLIDLKNRTGSVSAVCFRSVTAGVKALSGGMAATTASDYGALNVYIDDDGLYSCEAMRWLVTVEYHRYPRLADVRRWLKEWMPKINVAPSTRRPSNPATGGTAG